MKTVGAIERRDIGRGGEARTLAIDQIGGALAIVGIGGPHQHVGEAVAIEVACRGDRTAELVLGLRAVDSKTAAAVDRAQVHDRRESASLAEQHIGGSSLIDARWRGVGGAYEEIPIAVAVDVACVGDRATATVLRMGAVDAEAIGSVERQGIDDGRGAARLAEDHIGRAGGVHAVRRRIFVADDDVGFAISVDVADTGVAGAADVVDPKAIGPVQGCQIQGCRKTAGGSKHDVCGVIAFNHEILTTVAVDISRCERNAQGVIRRVADDMKTVGSVQAAEIDRSGRSRLAEQHVDTAGRVIAVDRCLLGTDG